MMPLSWDQEWRAPSRAELEWEAYEDWLYDTYDTRFRDFCGRFGYDPESFDAAIEFETYWDETITESGGDPYGGYPR